MIDQLYFSDVIGDDYIKLDKFESKHFTKVMRNTVGKTTYITDGLGTLYKCTFHSNTSDISTFSIINKIKNFKKRDYYLHIAIAPTKNMKRIDWLIEKSVEIGIDEISFLSVFRSEREKINIDRLYRIAISSLKQSKTTFLPKINNISKLSSFMPKISETIKLIASTGQEVNHISNFIKKNSRTCILIGPEGGFTNKELDEAIDNSLIKVSFGKNILRTETAAVHICSIINNAI